MRVKPAKRLIQTSSSSSRVLPRAMDRDFNPVWQQRRHFRRHYRTDFAAGVFRCQQPLQQAVLALDRIAGEQQQRRRRRIMTILHPRRPGNRCRGQSLRSACLHLTKTGFQHFLRHAAGPQNRRNLRRTVQHGRFQPDLAGAVVENQFDPSSHVGHHRRRRRRTGPAGEVGARRGNRHSGAADQRPRHSGGWKPHRHRIESRRHDIRHAGRPGQHHGKRTRPKPVQQRFEPGRHFPHQRRQIFPFGNVQDERIVGRPALGLKNPAHRRGVQPICPQPINRFGGKRHQSALPKDPPREFDRRSCSFRLVMIKDSILCLHAAPASVSAGRNTTTRSIPA